MKSGARASGIVTAVVTIIGGFGGVAYTDAIQTSIMHRRLHADAVHRAAQSRRLGRACQACKAPVPDAMHIARPWTDPNYPFWGIILGAIYGGMFYWGMDQVNVQRMLGARRPGAGALGRDVRRAA